MTNGVNARVAGDVQDAGRTKYTNRQQPVIPAWEGDNNEYRT